MRQSARDRLFVLRDELRNRYIEIQDSSDKATLRAFKEVDNGINRSLNRLHLLTFSNVIFTAINAERNHVEHQQSLEKFHGLLMSAQDEKPKEIVVKVEKVLKEVLGANSLLFLIYLIPFILIFKLIGAVYNRLKSKMKSARSYMVEVCMIEKTLSRSESMFRGSDNLAA
jgi:hypothetical protein